MEVSIDIILLLVISFVLGVLVGIYIKKIGQENLINLDDSRKVELTKCCTDPKCYSKPPYLREDCIKNKEKAKEELDKEFKQMYTQEEYYKKLEELGITKKGELTNKKVDEAYYAKLNQKLVINPALDTKLDETIRKDDRDEVRGYDKIDLASYKPM